MSDPTSASPLLAELRRLKSAQDAVTLTSIPMLDMPVGSMSVDPMSAYAVVDMQHKITALIAGATDADLAAAYQETNGEPGGMEPEALLAEIERRNLNI